MCAGLPAHLSFCDGSLHLTYCVQGSPCGTACLSSTPPFLVLRGPGSSRLGLRANAVRHGCLSPWSGCPVRPPQGMGRCWSKVQASDRRRLSSGDLVHGRVVAAADTG